MPTSILGSLSCLYIEGIVLWFRSSSSNLLNAAHSITIHIPVIPTVTGHGNKAAFKAAWKVKFLQLSLEYFGSDSPADSRGTTGREVLEASEVVHGSKRVKEVVKLTGNLSILLYKTI